MKKIKNIYNPETYWTKVAESLLQRENGQQIAGDLSPFYLYKRKKFLEMLVGLDFRNKDVLEFGCGPGGNLKVISTLSPHRLVGVDISEQMLNLAKNNNSSQVELTKTNGSELPFPDNSFDLVFTATVLQHNVIDEDVTKIVAELTRVSRTSIILFERISYQRGGNDSCVGRPISFYKDLCAAHGFNLTEKKFLNIQVSQNICNGIQKLFNSAHKEGQTLSNLTIKAQSILLPFSKIIDPIFPLRRDLAMLHFSKGKQAV